MLGKCWFYENHLIVAYVAISDGVEWDLTQSSAIVTQSNAKCRKHKSFLHKAYFKNKSDI